MKALDLAPRRRIGRVALGDVLHRATRRFGACAALVKGGHRTSFRTLDEDANRKSPLCLRGTKEMISYVRDRPVADGLNYIATWNAAMLYSEDLDEARRAARPPSATETGARGGPALALSRRRSSA
ncbi:hypothetical protein QTH89_03835 [Variovorax sp. J22G21]|uniref:hypothetical protein n=1 Tax=Variovorax fucosicus TaxID=3053517 RepID=UPI002575F577|nr:MULTISPECIES: hypothetical protein [unclassified Variovorax]MDM0041272.1 hypothetical protein [Variovorax sp. J22R193]MDM0060329.1 hypothetical protein [Variovorax sp. J22G21]